MESVNMSPEEKEFQGIMKDFSSLLTRMGKFMKPTPEAKEACDRLTESFMWTRMYMDHNKSAHFEPKMEAKLKGLQKVSESEKH